MKRRKLFWHLYPYLFIIVIISLILTAIYASQVMRNIHINEVSQTLENRAKLLKVQLEDLISSGDTVKIDSLCKEYGRLIDTRISIIDPEGTVLGDSDKDPRLMENHGTRPEIVFAFNGTTGFATRFSNTLQKNMKYVALPVIIEGDIKGVIRTSMPASDIEETLGEFYWGITFGGFVIILLSVLIGFFILKRFTNPLEKLQKWAENFTEGDLGYKLFPSNIDEIASLTESINRMAEQLSSRIEIIVDQRNEREAILTNMTEGILALDSKQNIVTFNRAAAEFFDLKLEDVLGKSIYEVLRITDLHKLVEETIKSESTIEKELRFQREGEKYIQAHGTPLKDISANRIGMVLVFNDITGFKKLENIRRDFVANVSHELKTPITAIMGSAETLLDATINSPEDRDKFLNMIIRHSDRLNSLVDDLLELARLDSEIDEGKVELSQHKLIDVVNSSIVLCKPKSETAQVQIDCDCDSSIKININFRQIEQAISNLIDNAIKHSKPDKSILVKTTITENEIIISVVDQGCGIEGKHLSRLFERFYRVDNARSRAIGGTGLGLAIVKHVALAHGGDVSVESISGKGSTFQIHLPIDQ